MNLYRKCTLLWLVAALSSAALFAQTANLRGVPGTVVAHSPASTKIYLGSPSIAILPNGDYVASHDMFGPSSTEHVKAVSRIYRSSDKGKTWNRIAEINGAFWSKLFVHNGLLYFMGTNRHHGNAIIRRSEDNGSTWTEPVDRNSGLLLEGEYHCGAMPVVEYKGRLWRAMEDAMGPIKEWGKRYGAFMMSVPADADLLRADNWTSSNVLRFDSTLLNGHFNGWVEGNAVIGPGDTIWDILRVDDRSTLEQKAALVRISPDGKTASFNEKDFVPFPGGSAKFTIRYDEKTNRYWTLSNFIPEDQKKAVDRYPEKKKKRRSSMVRNTLALCSSSDLRNWKVHKILLQAEDMKYIGFQYVDWQFEKNNIIFLSRTAYPDGLGGANSAHNSNLITFHRIKKFRRYKDKMIH